MYFVFEICNVNVNILICRDFMHSTHRVLSNFPDIVIIEKCSLVNANYTRNMKFKNNAHRSFTRQRNDIIIITFTPKSTLPPISHSLNVIFLKLQITMYPKTIHSNGCNGASKHKVLIVEKKKCWTSIFNDSYSLFCILFDLLFHKFSFSGNSMFFFLQFLIKDSYIWAKSEIRPSCSQNHGVVPLNWHEMNKDTNLVCIL